MKNDKFYIKCSKPLVLRLPNHQDRCLACAWLQRLSQDPSISESVKNDYLKLLIYFLQIKKLGYPFIHHPSQFTNLNLVPEELDIRYPNLEKVKNQNYYIDYSGDLRTYVAYQEMKDFGIQCFYAFSSDPFTHWHQFDKNAFSRKLKPGGFKNAGFTDPENEELEMKKQEFAEEVERKLVQEMKKMKNLVPGIGTKEEEDDRLRPTWGSNLLYSTKI